MNFDRFHGTCDGHMLVFHGGLMGKYEIYIKIDMGVYKWEINGDEIIASKISDRYFLNC